MSIKSLLSAALLALAVQGAQAAPHTLTLVSQGNAYSAGLSTQEGSTLVTRTESGAFRDEFLIHFDGLAILNAWVETSADLSVWGNQGVSFTRAGFVGIDGSELLFDSFDMAGTRFMFGNSEPVQARGDFLFFVEGVAGDANLQQTLQQSLRNSFSYSGGINLEPVGELPEPSSLALAGLAVAGLLCGRRRRRG